MAVGSEISNDLLVPNLDDGALRGGNSCDIQHEQINAQFLFFKLYPENLARVQALFVFQFIRLFGSDIRHRSRAEASIATLLRMNSKIWESAHTEAYLETSLGCDGLFSQSLSFGGSFHSTTDPISQQWRNWLLAESVRRTCLMVNYTMAIYLTLRDGHGSCSGGVAFTAREGL
ncbi:hypothetical protein PWT90_09051 [Aphanocladium album]|nr:hypothetical protein PWT90_09051 [Aphanocladium album]